MARQQDERGLRPFTATLRNTGLVHRPYYLNPDKKRLLARPTEMRYRLWK